MNFVTLHVDTANQYRDSVCRIKIIEVVNNEIKNEYVELIKPPKEHYFDELNVLIHGITEDEVRYSEEFPSVIARYSDILNNSLVFVCNASFHMSSLRYMYDYYELEYPNFQIVCNSILAKKTLPQIGIYDTKYLLKYFKMVSKPGKEALLTMELLKNLDKENITESISNSGMTIGRFESPNIYKPSLSKRIYVSKDERYGLNDLEYDESKHKPESPFYQSTVVFTGSLKSMVRKDALKMVAEIGGFPSDTLTTKTNYLVCGDDDLEYITPDTMTGKYKKAIGFASKGFDIEIVNESFFLENIN